MADEKKGFLLRLPPPLLDELRRWAEQEMRSVNGQIEWILRQALRQHTGHDDLGEGTAAARKKPRA